MNAFVHQPSLLAAGIFGSIGMLAWASIALVPLLLHFWNRRKHRETNWAAMEFLLAAVQEQSKRLRIEQLLLLFLRIAIPCVFALALADPLWQLLPSQGNSLSSRPPYHHIFLIDTSYSMGYSVDGQSRLQQGLQFARNVVEQSPQGDGFTLLCMSSPSHAVVASPAYEKNDILAELDRLTTRDCRADLLSAVRIAKKSLETTRESHPRLSQHRLYIVSDMGQNTWQAAEQSSVRSTIADIESQAQVVMADVSVTQNSNAAIVAARRDTTLPVLGAALSWTLTTRTYNSSQTAIDIEMRVDGHLVEKKRAELAGQRLTTTTFTYRFNSAGQHTVSFHLPDDALSTDNHRSEVIAIQDSIRVLCVEGRKGAARNIELALAPKINPQLRIQTTTDHGFGNLDLHPFDSLFICNAGNITADQATKMRDFLQQGGGIVMFLGDQSQVENYNHILGATHDGFTPILPGKLITAAPYGRYSFAPDDYRHPLIQPFRGQEKSGLISTPVWSYVQIELTRDHHARVALSFRNGDPAILEHAVLGGKFALVTTAPSQLSVVQQGTRSSPWNAWSVWPSFPPIVQELLAHSVGGQDDLANVVVGQSIGGTLPTNDTSRTVTVLTPSQQEHRVTVQDSISTPRWSWSKTHKAGIYTAKSPDSDSFASFAVNLDSYQESELTRIRPELLPKQFQRNTIEISTSEPTQSQLESAPLFRRLLGLLLVLLITESVVAWYFGNRRL